MRTFDPPPSDPEKPVDTKEITGGGTVSVDILLLERLVRLGITEASPTAGITDYNRKVTDELGEVTVVPRAWTAGRDTLIVARLLLVL